MNGKSWCLRHALLFTIQMEEKVKEIVEIKQRSLAEENQKTLEVLKERYLSCGNMV